MMSNAFEMERRNLALIDSFGHARLPDGVRHDRRTHELEDLLFKHFRASPEKQELVGVPGAQKATVASKTPLSWTYLILAVIAGALMAALLVMFLKMNANRKFVRAVATVTEHALYEWHGHHRLMPALPETPAHGA